MVPLGLATATTSATFFPQFEQRIRAESAASVTDLPAIRASASGSMCGDAPQGDAHQEVAEAFVESLDVGQHAHGSIVRGAGGHVHSARDSVGICMALRERALLVCIVITASAVTDGCVTSAPGAEQMKITRDSGDAAACTAIGNIAADTMNDLDPVVAANRAAGLNADVVLNTGNGGVAYRCDKEAGPRH